MPSWAEGRRRFALFLLRQEAVTSSMLSLKSCHSFSVSLLLYVLCLLYLMVLHASCVLCLIVWHGDVSDR